MILALTTGGIIFWIVLLVVAGAALAAHNRRRDDDLQREAAVAEGSTTKDCPECKLAVPIDAKRCGHCGYRLRGSLLP